MNTRLNDSNICEWIVIHCTFTGIPSISSTNFRLKRTPLREFLSGAHTLLLLLPLLLLQALEEAVSVDQPVHRGAYRHHTKTYTGSYNSLQENVLK